MPSERLVPYNQEEPHSHSRNVRRRHRSPRGDTQVMTQTRHVRTDSRSAAKVARVLVLGCTVYTAAVLCFISILLNSPSLYAGINAESYALLHAAAFEHVVAIAVLLPLLLWLRRRATLRPLATKSLLPLTLLFLLASVDRLVGVAFPPPLRQNTIFQPHKARGWTNIPNGRAMMEVEIMLDKNGLRIDESSPESYRSDGRIRIMFLGDSITFGFYQHARDTYGARTAAILNEHDPKLDVVALNAGTTGYDTWQEWHYFENKAVLLKPDALVLQFCLNDAAAMYDPHIGPDMRRHPQASQIARPMHWSGLYRAIIALAARSKFGENVQEGAQALEHFQMEELLQPELNPQALRAMELVESHMARIAACCRRNQIPFIIVCFPMRSQLSSGSLVPQPQRMLREFCEQKEIAYLDLLPAFVAGAANAEDGIDGLFIDHTHPTRAGHALAAEALATFLKQSGLIGELDRRAAAKPTTTQHRRKK